MFRVRQIDWLGLANVGRGCLVIGCVRFLHGLRNNIGLGHTYRFGHRGDRFFSGLHCFFGFGIGDDIGLIVRVGFNRHIVAVFTICGRIGLPLAIAVGIFIVVIVETAIDLVDMGLGGLRPALHLLVFSQQCFPIFERDLIIIWVDFIERQEPMAIPAVIDKCGLQRRFNPRHLGKIDVTF